MATLGVSFEFVQDVLYLFGPNLDRLGLREPEVYGSQTFDELSSYCRDIAEEYSLSASVIQTNSEAVFIESIHQAMQTYRAIILNPGAFTHYSYAIADALSMFLGPKLEVHLSNIFARELWRHRSVVSPVVSGSIVGLGALGFKLATGAVSAILTGVGSQPGG